MDQPFARDRYITAQDGLRLFYREWGDPLLPATPVLCLAGLVRTSDDFTELAEHLAQKRRVLALDLRGRGRSDYDPDPDNYAPPTYVMDIGALLTAANIHKVAVIGTSLGGLLAMALALTRPASLAGVVLNDIGPEIDQRGVERIRGYVGKTPPPQTMDQARQQLATNYGVAFPDFGEDDWRAMAASTYEAKPDGTLSLRYDPAISKSIANGPEMDLWKLFGALANVPVLSIRGGLSDLLSEATVERMAKEKPDLERLTVPNRGHTPTLNEPICRTAIDAFLDRLDGAH
ncbi:MAG: alpha/beta hydrolase [Alphaproteobacteria bacterium]